MYDSLRRVNIRLHSRYLTRLLKSEGRFFGPTVTLGFLIAALACERLAAEPARFWVSASNSGPQMPGAPTIPSAGGDTQYLYIWAQPTTLNSGPYHATTNPFKVLRNFSLNVVTFSPTVDFLNDEIEVYDPQRFEYVNDSSSDPPLTSARSAPLSSPDKISGLQGFSISSVVGSGIGPTCSGGSYCTTMAGVPAWLVASVSYRIVQSSAPAEIYLQIGDDGMNHLNQSGVLESSTLTSVIFGAGTSQTTQVYNAGNPSHRSWTNPALFPTDTPDLVVEQITPGDFNHDGRLDAADYVVWRKNNGTQAEFDGWRSHFGEMSGSGSGSSNSPAVPEPEALLLLVIGIGLLPLVQNRCGSLPVA